MATGWVVSGIGRFSVRGAPPGRVEQESDGRVGQLLDIGFGQESGLPVPDDLVDARGADGDGRQSAGVRLGQHESLGLGL